MPRSDRLSDRLKSPMRMPEAASALEFTPQRFGVRARSHVPHACFRLSKNPFCARTHAQKTKYIGSFLPFPTPSFNRRPNHTTTFRPVQSNFRFIPSFCVLCVLLWQFRFSSPYAHPIKLIPWRRVWPCKEIRTTHQHIIISADRLPVGQITRRLHVHRQIGQSGNPKTKLPRAHARRLQNRRRH